MECIWLLADFVPQLLLCSVEEPSVGHRQLSFPGDLCMATPTERPEKAGHEFPVEGSLLEKGKQANSYGKSFCELQQASLISMPGT